MDILSKEKEAYKARLKQAEDKWGLIADFFEEFRKEVGEGRALEIAERALLAYQERLIEDYLEGLEGKERFEAWIRRLQRNAETNPFLEVVEVSPNKVSIKITRCFAEEVLRKRGLVKLCQKYCDSDFEVTRVIHPKVKLIREHTLAKGDDYCDHCWIWEE